MNHINWVQQDPDYQTKYHVLKWNSSHFHEPQARQMADSALHKEGAAFAVSAGQEQTGMQEIGFGQASTVKSGGFALGHGQEGAAQLENAGTEKGQDSVAISGQSIAGQDSAAISGQGIAGQDSAAIAGQGVVGQGREADPQMVTRHSADRQPAVPQNTAAVGQGSIRNQLKRSAAYLQELYEKQKQKIKKTLFHTKKAEKKPELQKKPGRKADREETLSMQARNHYLLDSYDRNGQYHMLGK